MWLGLAVLTFIVGYVVGRLRGPVECSCIDDTDELRVEAAMLARRLQRTTHKLAAAIQAVL